MKCATWHSDLKHHFNCSSHDTVVDPQRLLRLLLFCYMTSSKGLSSASRKPLHLCGLCKVVVRHLREQVVHYMGANVMVNLVEDAVVTVDGGQPPPEIAPLLAQVRSAT